MAAAGPRLSSRHCCSRKVTSSVSSLMAGSGVITRQYCSCTAASSMICRRACRLELGTSMAGPPPRGLADTLGNKKDACMVSIHQLEAHVHGKRNNPRHAVLRCNQPARGTASAGPRAGAGRALPSSAMSDAGVSVCAGGGCGMGAAYGGGTSVCASTPFAPGACPPAAAPASAWPPRRRHASNVTHGGCRG